MKTTTDLTLPATSRLFRRIDMKTATEILNALGAIMVHYKKGETVIKQWSPATHHYLVVSGEIHSCYNHTNGKRSVNGVFRHGDSLGLMFAFCDLHENPSSAVAARDSTLIKIPFVDIIHNDILIGTEARRQYIQNVVDIISQSAFMSRLRSFVLEQPRIEDRVRTYLNEKSKHFDSSEFTINFDRQGLADFICCDRTSLCSVLGVMKSKGLIDFHKNTFRIIVPAE